MISIITPLYNKADYIGDTVESVRRQTLADWEWWVIDNGSTDGGATIVRRFAETDARIRLLEFTRAQGPGAARNFGLSAATGDWVLFLDADDLIEPDYLASRLTAVSGGVDTDVVAGPWQEFADGQPEVLHRRLPPAWGQDGTRLTDQAIGFAPWPPLAALVRRAWLGGERLWQEDLDRVQSEDTAFWFRVLYGARLVWSDAEGARYRTSTPSSRDAIRDVRKRFDAICAVTDRNIAFVRSLGHRLTPAQRRTLVRVFEDEARRADQAGEADLARQARQRAGTWLVDGPVLFSPGMLLRRVFGLKNFLLLQTLGKRRKAAQ